jgi:hypothetical protein
MDFYSALVSLLLIYLSKMITKIIKIKQRDIYPLKILFVSYAPFKNSVSLTVNLSKNKKTNTPKMLKKNVVEAYRS